MCGDIPIPNLVCVWFIAANEPRGAGHSLSLGQRMGKFTSSHWFKLFTDAFFHFCPKEPTENTYKQRREENFSLHPPRWERGRAFPESTNPFGSCVLPASSTQWHQRGQIGFPSHEHTTSWELKQDGGADPAAEPTMQIRGGGKAWDSQTGKAGAAQGGGCSFGLPYVSDLLSSELDFVFLEELSAREQEKRRERYRKYGDQTWGKKKINHEKNTDLSG